MATGRSHLGLDGGGTLRQGTRLQNAADDLDSVGKLLGKGVESPQYIVTSLFGDEKFGEYGADSAFPSFARAWNEEVGVLADALRELHKKIGDGVVTTTGEDKHAGDRLRSVEALSPPAAGAGEGPR